jgi:hypothetical protein
VAPKDPNRRVLYRALAGASSVALAVSVIAIGVIAAHPNWSGAAQIPPCLLFAISIIGVVGFLGKAADNPIRQGNRILIPLHQAF